jgi:hypothetical protein
MNTNATKSRSELERQTRTKIENWYLEFAEMSPDQQQEEMKWFDVADETFAANPRVRKFFQNLRNAFLTAKPNN